MGDSSLFPAMAMHALRRDHGKQTLPDFSRELSPTGIALTLPVSSASRCHLRAAQVARLEIRFSFSALRKLERWRTRLLWLRFSTRRWVSFVAEAPDAADADLRKQPERIRNPEWIFQSVSVDIQPACKPNRMTLDVPPLTRGKT